MRVGDLQVISENGCEADFQARDSGQLNLLCLITGDPFFATSSKLSKFVETFIVPLANKPTVFR